MADDTPEVGERRDGGSRRLLLVIALALAIIFIAQNSQEVRVDFLFADFEAPLLFTLLIATVLGFIIGWLFARFRRRD